MTFAFYNKLLVLDFSPSISFLKQKALFSIKCIALLYLHSYKSFTSELSLSTKHSQSQRHDDMFKAYIAGKQQAPTDIMAAHHETERYIKYFINVLSW